MNTLLFSSKLSQVGLLLVTLCAEGAFSASACAASKADELDKLTGKWLQIEKQEQLLLNEWKERKPSLEQRIALLKAEQKQLQQILQQSSASQDDVEARRNALLAEQNSLEEQQSQVSRALQGLRQRSDSLYSALPEPVQVTWDKEQAALDNEADTSQQLQVVLAKLSRLGQFNQQVSVNEGILAAPDGSDVVVKQLFLGSSYAWFSNSDGKYAGYGKAIEGNWRWTFDSDIDAQQISKAIAIFEKRHQPELVQLPVLLEDPASAALTSQSVGSR
ncbi:DUF3450 family protein [Alteromonas pelagimontana]|uniref:DUF3450 family protein n=1 Tax=Alteromonas pelagimontana TaxID=1858656 RepID=A0A6M4MC76_9ALTE|nr:DUF3450 family protein [Alteromonas pelagimontana]QJR80791.1 DUF3450 family protein [Alteromonas pelagimontana]